MVEISFEDEQQYFINQQRAYPTQNIVDGELYMGINSRRGDVELFVKQNGTISSIDAVVMSTKTGEIKLTSVSDVKTRSSQVIPNYNLGMYEIRERDNLPGKVKTLFSH